MRFLPSLVFLLCCLGQAAAAVDPILPTVPEVLLDSDQQVVRMPAPYARACTLLHHYNGSRDFPQATVPTVRDWRQAGAHDGQRQAWATSMAAFLDTTGADQLTDGADWRVFPLFQEIDHQSRSRKPTGFLVLFVPRHIDASEMQDTLESLHAAAGWGEFPVSTIRKSGDLGDMFLRGIQKIAAASGLAQMEPGNYAMILVGLLLFYLGIARGFEPLLLVPIAMGCIFVNSIGADMVKPPSPAGTDGGILYYFFEFGISTGIFPLLIFLGVGALTDFGPLLANPWSALLGGAAQFGIFGSFFLAALFGDFFTLQQAGAIAIIGGADGPTSIYVASQLAPELLGAIAVAAYSYMALVPILQPPVMRALTNDQERRIMMEQRKPVSRQAKIIFPVVVILLCLLLLPSAVPLIGMLMFGNLLRECGVTDRLSKTAQNELINIVTIGLGLSVGTKLAADKFLTSETILILVLGVIAFIVGTAAGVIMAKVMNRISGGRINPLIGSAGVSAVPMAARVSQVEGVRYNRQNMLLMHAMGPNVAGVIGSAVAAGILLALLGN